MGRASKLPSGLTSKETAAVAGLVGGLSKSQAYRQAYNCEASSPRCITANSQKLFNSTRIRLAVQEQRALIDKETTASTAITREACQSLLLEGIQMAREQGHASTVLDGAAKLSNLLGLAVDASPGLTVSLDLGKLMAQARDRITIDHKSDQESLEAPAPDSHEDKIERTVNK